MKNPEKKLKPEEPNPHRELDTVKRRITERMLRAISMPLIDSVIEKAISENPDKNEDEIREDLFKLLKAKWETGKPFSGPDGKNIFEMQRGEKWTVIDKKPDGTWSVYDD